MQNFFKISALIVFLLPASCKDEEKASNTKIVGGTLVQSDTDPTMRSTVALLSSKGSLCTGTLIGPNHVLTAAHCIDNSADLQLGYGSSPQAIPGVRVIGAKRHPRWIKGPNDVAVVVFEGTLPPSLAPVGIAPMTGINNGARVVLAGYGVTGERSQDSGTLRKTTAQIRQFQPSVREFEMQEGLGTGSCYGDSGGPAYIEQGNVLTVIGATSRGSNCDTGDGVYGDVRYFQGWYKCTFKALGKPLRSLLNDSSNSDCAPGTIDSDVGSDTGNVAVPDTEDTKVAIGESGSLPDSYKIKFSAAKSSTGAAIELSYCLGTIITCAPTSATWIPVTRTGTIGSRDFFVTPQPLVLQNDLVMTTKSVVGASTTVNQVTFKKR